MTPLERFLRQTVALSDGCWLWTGHLGRGGYPQFNDGTATVRAHRFGHEALVGPIPDGLDLDHLCRNRWCVNPEHLEPVTRSENLRRGYAARGVKAECAQGHPFDDANTFRRNDGGRGCRTCRNNASRAAKARARQTATAA